MADRAAYSESVVVLNGGWKQVSAGGLGSRVILADAAGAGMSWSTVAAPVADQGVPFSTPGRPAFMVLDAPCPTNPIYVKGPNGAVLTVLKAGVAAVSAGVVPLPTLGPLKASFVKQAAPGTLIATITGLATGERVVGVSPNDERFALVGDGTALVVGLTPNEAGTVGVILTTDAGRSLTLPVTVLSDVYGRTAANLAAWQRALALGRGRVILIGDSETVGAGAGTGPMLTDGAEPLSKPAQLVSKLRARGIPAKRNSFFGARGLPNFLDVKAYDARFSGLTTGWGGGPPSLGGVTFASGASPDNLMFRPADAVDTIEVYHLRDEYQPNGGQLTIDGSATVIAAINSNAPAGPSFVGKTAATVSKGVHTFGLRGPGNAYQSFVGAIAYDSAAPGIEIINAGVYGTSAAYHTVAGSGDIAAENALAVVGPSLVVVQLTTNDLNAGTALATWSAGIQSIIAKAKAAGASVVLENAVHAASGYGTPEQRAAYRDELIRLGQAHGCMVIDYAFRFPSPDLADGVHPTAALYAAQADVLLSALLS